MLLIFIIVTVLIIRDHPYALSSIDTSLLQEKENLEENQNRSITSNISFLKEDEIAINYGNFTLFTLKMKKLDSNLSIEL